MIKLLEEYTNKSMKDQGRMLEEVLLSYQGLEDRNDDITIIGFKYKGAV